MPKQYWLVKSEPESYSWEKFVEDGSTAWTGVRNFQARNNLRTMKAGDVVFFYHSVTGKDVVGVAKVSKENFPDPTAGEGDWSAVEIRPVKGLKRPVTLEQIKNDSILKEMKLVRASRLSVSPVSEEQAARLLEVAETRI
jgi:predicted RNA-binding protein with PUA-like domain